MRVGIEELTRPPKHETNAEAFKSELQEVEIKYPELTIIGISSTDIEKRATEGYVTEVEAGLLEKARKTWHLLRSLEVQTAEKSVVFVAILGDYLIANVARNDIDEIALKNGGSQANKEPFSTTNVFHFLGYGFQS